MYDLGANAQSGGTGKQSKVDDAAPVGFDNPVEADLEAHVSVAGE